MQSNEKMLVAENFAEIYQSGFINKSFWYDVDLLTKHGEGN